jgi:hypothetical protein
LIDPGRFLVKGAEQRQTPAVDWLDSLISLGGLGFSSFPPICRVPVLVLGLGLEKNKISKLGFKKCLCRDHILITSGDALTSRAN